MHTKIRYCMSCRKWFIGRDKMCPPCRADWDEVHDLLPKVQDDLKRVEALPQRDKNQEN